MWQRAGKRASAPTREGVEAGRGAWVGRGLGGCQKGEGGRYHMEAAAEGSCVKRHGLFTSMSFVPCPPQTPGNARRSCSR